METSFLNDLDVREQLDRVQIERVVQAERIARDLADWERMKSFYHADSTVDIAWFRGSGSEFVTASAKMLADGAKTFHQMSPTVSVIAGDRALTDTGAAIHFAGSVNGIDVDVISYTRLRERLQRDGNRWLIAGFRAIYWQDTMVPFDPSHAPHLDAATLASYRPSYKFLSYVLSLQGHLPGPNHPGIDRPDLISAFLAAENCWLHA